MSSRFDRLIARHRELDRQIESQRRGHDRLQDTGRLKRLRLAIKDEIQMLRTRQSSPAR